MRNCQSRTRRRGWDSNPRGTFIPAGFQVREIPSGSVQHERYRTLVSPSRSVLTASVRRLGGQGGGQFPRSSVRPPRFVRPVAVKVLVRNHAGHFTRWLPSRLPRALGPNKPAFYPQVSMQSERRLGRGCILDFYHPDAKVCIEVDGAYHGRHCGRDGRRDRDLRLMGVETIGLENSDVPKASSATEIEARLLDEMRTVALAHAGRDRHRLTSNAGQHARLVDGAYHGRHCGRDGRPATAICERWTLTRCDSITLTC